MVLLHGNTTIIPLGNSFPTVSPYLYQLRFYSPGSGTIGYYVKNFETDVQVNGILSTNIPSSASLLAPHVWINSGAPTVSSGTILTASIDIANVYLDTSL